MEIINKSRHLPTKHSTSQEDHFKPYIPAAEQRGILEGALDKIKLVKTGAGFTLIELLVVIAVIGLLASVILVALNSTRAKARDVKRIADLKQLAKALEIYYDKYNQYPNPILGVAVTGCATPYTDFWEVGNKANPNPFLQALVTDGIIGSGPKETYWTPILSDNNTCSYRYTRNDWGLSGTCGAAGFKTVAVLYTKLENPRPPEGAQPNCLGGWGEASPGDPNGYMVYLKEN